MALVFTASCATGAGASRPKLTSAQRVAVHAYFLDLYEYAQAVSEAAPQVVLADEAAVTRFAGECPGAFVGAPQESTALYDPKLTARQRGEERRQSTQLSDLTSEMDRAISAAKHAPLGPARTALLAKLKALPLVAPALARAVRADTVGLEEDLHVEVPAACADIKVWVGSGYRTLSPASRAFARQEETEVSQFFRQLAGQSQMGQLSPEDPADKAIVRKTAQIELQTADADAGSILSAHERLRAAVGLETHEREPEPKPTKSITSKIGTGRTAARTKYTVWLERRKGGSRFGCKLRVEVRAASGAQPSPLQIVSSPESSVCVSSSERRSEPSVTCNGGLLRIMGRVSPATRTVELRLSDGRRIVSRPVLVSRRLGGPAAFYYQEVRGPSPIPVSLTERDRHGRALLVVKLERILECSKKLVKYLPGGRRTLLSGRGPRGPRFSIVGERYRLFGHLHSQLKLEFDEALSSSDQSNEEEGGDPSGLVSRPPTEPLDSETSHGCGPHEYSIFYGLLDRPRDTVLAKLAGKLVPVKRVRIPASLHAGGVLVYLVSSEQPEEILVRTPNGRAVVREDRRRQAREARETCEGESEGALGPPPGAFSEVGETSRIVLKG